MELQDIPQPSCHGTSDIEERTNLLLSDTYTNDIDGDGTLPDINTYAEAAPQVPQVQPGVQSIEAVTVAWTSRALIFAYAMIWLTYFVEGMLLATTSILTPYVTSTFALHSLTPTVGILSSVIGGVTNLTLAKVLDVFGRPQGYLFCITFATAGLVMMAMCSNVQAYASAQVFQTVGNNGILYSLTVFVADTSSLRNRGLMQAIVSSPNLITCWLAGPISSNFLAGPGWRWAFGTFAILVPMITLPLFQLLLINYLKAKKMGLVSQSDGSNRDHSTLLQSLVYYSKQFDAIGIVLLSTGVALFLLPFNLYSLQGWDSPLVVSMLLAGGILIVSFVVWERLYAPITFLPYSLLLDRTVLGSCILSATLFVSFWCWNSFFSSYLQVVNNLSVKNASYVVQTYTICSVLSAIAIGSMIHYTGRFKPVCLYIGIPLSVLGSGLMIYCCKIDSSVGYMIMCQIFISIAAGMIMICDEVAILAAASHQHVAVCIAVLGMFGNVGGAVGLTVASAIWQSVFPRKLAEYLPAQELSRLPEIYQNLSTQLSYPIGSATRLAIQHAYRDAQINMLVVGTAVWVVGFFSVLVWRDINVIGVKQNKGHVW
ncbi:siderophore iron transporter [Trichophyton equinum CBS 127.97]|uniref:Siderophore iron transporter n=1 Tax=Trichophyton equinum (strain ATCC MYA-4606 / CBS 127.97) TaxID=559882 RepID=F2PUM4_TRIEC|nr:siderophore iron transporter [Trichophyton equinum CBS 127.97]